MFNTQENTNKFLQYLIRQWDKVQNWCGFAANIVCVYFLFAFSILISNIISLNAKRKKYQSTQYFFHFHIASLIATLLRAIKFSKYGLSNRNKKIIRWLKIQTDGIERSPAFV